MREKDKITVLVVGASGATGRLLVEELLDCGQDVKIIVRSKNNIPESIRNHINVSIIQASILDLSISELNRYVKGCNAIVSCLGHNLSFKGIFGKPRRLVTDATKRLCTAIKVGEPESTVKYILMNTVGNRNRDLNEKISFAERCVIWLLRILLPPHIDNEEAADFLRMGIGQNDNTIKWVVVRPSSLINEEDVSDYKTYTSPTRSAIFNDGKVSRVNVAAFMSKLVTDQNLWEKWKGQMPVIYKSNYDDCRDKV